jgi:hypothetical protein
MPRSNGPYMITHAFPERSKYTLKLPNSPNTFPGFHENLLTRYTPNDPLLFPDREPSRLRLIITEDGTKEWYINKIVDACRRGCGVQYLVCYEGYRKEHDKWRPGSEMANTDALDRWKTRTGRRFETSTGFSGFQLKTRRFPRLIPPIIPLPRDASTEQVTAHDIITQVALDVQEAQDNLTAAKICQAYHANEHRAPEDTYEVGDLVMLSTENRRCNYKRKGKTRVAKFMPRHDGPYTVTHAFPERSEYTLKLPNSPNTFPGFHANLLTRYTPNDPLLFPDREPSRPWPIVTEDGTEEWYIDKIVSPADAAAGYSTLSATKDMGRNTTSGTPSLRWPTLTPLTVGKTRTGQRFETSPQIFFSGEGCKPDHTDSRLTTHTAQYPRPVTKKGNTI